MNLRSRLRLLFPVVLLALLVAPIAASANHSWNGYHWARTANPFALQLGDNVSSTWDPILATASADWAKSAVLETLVAAGATRANCRPTRGRVEVCNGTYGNNGWLGVATIWIKGKHITQGTVKVNDTYFNTPRYNSTAWRNMVMCQEVGHTLGLDHQDENFNNTNIGTCMDYTSDPLGPPDNEHPNRHDYDELEAVYDHLDSTNTVAMPAVRGNAGSDNPDQWGALVRTAADGRGTLYRRDLGGGHEMFTFVLWAR